MTVGELIARLQECDSDGIVYVDDTAEGEMVEVACAYTIVNSRGRIDGKDVYLAMKDE